MVNQDLINYIQQSLSAGVKKEEIVTTLLNIGWQKIDVDEAFRQLEGAGPLYRFQPHISAPAIEIKAKKKGLALKISMIFFIIGLLTGGAWAYYYFIQHPQLALRQMPERMAKIENLKYDFSLAAGSASGIYKRELKEYPDRIIEKFQSHKRDLAKRKSLAKREYLDGILVYRYDLALDEEAAEWLAQAAYETEIGKDYEEFTQQEKEALEKIIENIREAAPKISKIDIYIGRSDLYLYKADVIYNDKNYSLKLSDFNNIESPELRTAKSIKNIYNDILNNLIISI